MRTIARKVVSAFKSLTLLASSQTSADCLFSVDTLSEEPTVGPSLWWRDSAPESSSSEESAAVAADAVDADAGDVDAGAAGTAVAAVAGASAAVAGACAAVDAGDDFDDALVSLGCTLSHYSALIEIKFNHNDLINKFALSVANQVRTNFRL